MIAELPEALDNALQIARRCNLVLELGGHRAESFAGCRMVVVSPGIPLSLPFFEISRRSGIPVIAEVELAGRHLPGKILAITGSGCLSSFFLS